jgi:hypothetical protein
MKGIQCKQLMLRAGGHPGESTRAARLSFGSKSAVLVGRYRHDVISDGNHHALTSLICLRTEAVSTETVDAERRASQHP